ncbi:MAG TPA: dihydrolipoamide acetyltransferase family protein [Solirubrobacteraceae bacterium]|jgi:pyruvate dehydrogenase E2 component (dihydrolipoamide acetyltransferase)
MSEIVMPRLSDSMEEGTILKWLKSDGESVARGEPLAEIETDKATLTYESDAAGVLTIVVAAGETLPIGEVIARLDDGSGDGTPSAEPRAGNGDSASQARAAGSESQAGDGGSGALTAGAEPATSADGAASPRPATGRVKASPLARRIAREQGVDLRLVTGTGPGGRVVKADVEEAARWGSAAVGTASEHAAATADSTTTAASGPIDAPDAATPPTTPAPATPARSAPSTPAPAQTGTAKGDITIQEPTRVQQVIARRMAESKATVPEFTLRMEIDMEACVDLRAQLKGLGGDVASYNDMVVRACALALREFPRANGSYRDGRFELHSRVNVGIAVAATDALVVPTIFDADRKSLREIARESRALAERVRAGTVTPPELSGATFTVSNLGMYGVTDFTAVINPPQAAILAVGALAPRAVVRDTPSGAQAAQLVARNTMAVTLACDHRILYGADAAQFLARIRALLEQPLALAF